MDESQPTVAPAPDPIRVLGDRLTALEGRQDKDDSDKKRENFYKRFALWLSSAALLVSIIGGSTSIWSAGISRKALALRESETEVRLKVSVLGASESSPTVDGRGSLYICVTNQGRATAITDVCVEYMSHEQLHQVCWSDPPQPDDYKCRLRVFHSPRLAEGRTVGVFALQGEQLLTFPHQVELFGQSYIRVELAKEWNSGKVIVYTSAGYTFEADMGDFLP